MHYKLSIQLVSVFKLVSMGIQLDGWTLGETRLLKLLYLYSKLLLQYELKINVFIKQLILHRLVFTWFKKTFYQFLNKI